MITVILIYTYQLNTRLHQWFILQTTLHVSVFHDNNTKITHTIIQGNQKVSVHLTITVHHQVHTDFLITLYMESTKAFKSFLTTRPTRCTNFSNLFLELNSTCFGQFLCPSSGVFHCTHSNCMLYRFAVCTVKNSWWWTEELSETCRI